MTDVRVIDRGWDNILREVKRAQRREVAVGILEGSANTDGAKIAEYAAWNEFGTTDNDDNERVPSRPFMRMAFDESVADIERDFAKQGKALYAGRRTADQCLTVIGMKHADRIKNVITGRDILPRLADSTEDRKGSTKTLVDTGAMVSAVQISVRGRTA